MSLESHMLAQLQTKPTTKRWVVAYSGGLDSTALLDLAVRANQRMDSPITICALHINHQLSSFSDQWQQHCQQQAKGLGVDLFSSRVDVQNSGQGVEAAARKARYGVFEEFIHPGDCLLMGHHSDDQAETLLLRLLRGAGVLGLTGMSCERPLKSGLLFRPLLKISREQLEKYALDKQLNWIHDESNESLEFDRNYLRHQVLPLMTSRWQQAKRQLVKTTERLQKAQALLNDLAELDLQQVDERTERYGFSVDWKKLKLLSEERINNALRFWCERKKFDLPDSQQLEQIHEQFFSSNAMLTSAVVAWSNVECRQFNYRFYLMSQLPAFIPRAESIRWHSCDEVDLGAAGKLRVKSADSDLSDDSAINASLNANNSRSKDIDLSNNFLVRGGREITIRWRQGGERCTPLGRSGSQTIKKLLQEYKLETWLRDRIPLIYIDEQLVAVGDLWVCKQPEKGIVVDQEAEVQLEWILDGL